MPIEAACKVRMRPGVGRGRPRLAETVSGKDFDSSFTDVVPTDVESIGEFNDCGRRDRPQELLSVERIDGKPLMETLSCMELF